jgi:hypothetical protein
MVRRVTGTVLKQTHRLQAERPVPLLRVSPHQRSARRRLARAIQGKGAFRRFKDQLHEEYPGLLPAWYAFLDARATRATGPK